MVHNRGVEALNEDIRSCNCLLGGVTVLLAGDFRQVLSVVPWGTRADEVKACFKSSFLWRTVKSLSLRVNMRVDLKAEEFSALTLKIGDGNYFRGGCKNKCL